MDARQVMRSRLAEGGAVGRVMRAIDLGIYDDVADARAQVGGELSDAEWADVGEWFAVLVDYPRA